MDDSQTLKIRIEYTAVVPERVLWLLTLETLLAREMILLIVDVPEMILLIADAQEMILLIVDAPEMILLIAEAPEVPEMILLVTLSVLRVSSCVCLEADA